MVSVDSKVALVKTDLAVNCRRMQTNATIAFSNNNQTATLQLNGQTLIAELLSPSAGAFSTVQPVALAGSVAVPSGAESANQPNPGVTVLVIDLGPGAQVIEVLFR